jgi:hypothetical protein
MNFTNLRKKAKEQPELPKTLGLTKQECAVIMGLIGDSKIQIKDLQFFYDLVYKLQEFIEENEVNG